jgi:hypothetical protein
MPHDPTTPPSHPENSESRMSPPFTDVYHAAQNHAFVGKARVIDAHSPISNVATPISNYPALPFRFKQL